MTGLTDRMRSDFNLMRELARHTITPPENKMRDVKRLFERIEKSEDCCKVSTEWKVELDQRPLQVEGLKMDAGSFVLAQVSEKERDAFDAETTRDVERRMQSPMYS